MGHSDTLTSAMTQQQLVLLFVEKWVHESNFKQNLFRDTVKNVMKCH